jgi:hypothetical protein
MSARWSSESESESSPRVQLSLGHRARIVQSKQVSDGQELVENKHQCSVL